MAQIKLNNPQFSKDSALRPDVVPTLAYRMASLFCSEGAGDLKDLSLWLTPEKEIRVHKSIISTGSRALQDLIQSCEAERTSGIFLFEMEDKYKNLDEQSFLRMIEFVYTDGIKGFEKIGQEELDSLHDIAKLFEVTSLLAYCAKGIEMDTGICAESGTSLVDGGVDTTVTPGKHDPRINHMNSELIQMQEVLNSVLARLDTLEKERREAADRTFDTTYKIWENMEKTEKNVDELRTKFDNFRNRR